MQTLFSFNKTSYLNEEVNCTEPFPSVSSVPWTSALALLPHHQRRRKKCFIILKRETICRRKILGEDLQVPFLGRIGAPGDDVEGSARTSWCSIAPGFRYYKRLVDTMRFWPPTWEIGIEYFNNSFETLNKDNF